MSTWKELPLSAGRVALISDCDFDHVSRFKWYCTENPGENPGRKRKVVKEYAVRNEKVLTAEGKNKRTKLYLHRFIMNPGAELVVDHINGDGLDNRRENLRVATYAENARNKKKAKTEEPWL